MNLFEMAKNKVQGAILRYRANKAVKHMNLAKPMSEVITTAAPVIARGLSIVITSVESSIKNNPDLIDKIATRVSEIGEEDPSAIIEAKSLSKKIINIIGSDIQKALNEEEDQMAPVSDKIVWNFKKVVKNLKDLLSISLGEKVS